MIFETHAHYDDDAFNEDRDELFIAMHENNVEYIINQGINVKTSKFAISLAEKYPYVYAAVGIHPEDVNELEYLNEIKKYHAIWLLQSKNVVFCKPKNVKRGSRVF